MRIPHVREAICVTLPRSLSREARIARPRLFALALALAGAAADPASAQTIDPIFRSWRWTEEVTTARTLGLGGAITGLADDGAAAAFNPAGLATIPRAGELQLGLRTVSQATLASGDGIRHLTKGTSPATLALRLGSRVGLSYHFIELRSASRIDFDDGREKGTLKTSVNGPGVGLGVRVSPFVNIGLSVTAYRFYVNEGDYTRVTDGHPDAVVRFNSNGDTRVAGTLRLTFARLLAYLCTTPRFDRLSIGLRLALFGTRARRDPGSRGRGPRSPGGGGASRCRRDQ